MEPKHKYHTNYTQNQSWRGSAICLLFLIMICITPSHLEQHEMMHIYIENLPQTSVDDRGYLISIALYILNTVEHESEHEPAD